MSKLKELQAHGQSIWLDYIKQSLMDSGELEALIRDGLLGLTSNPSIFEKAIADSSEYGADILKLASSSLSPKEVYEHLAISDVQRAADAFRATYESTGGRDGYVSLEVSPELARNTVGTLSEARRLWKCVGRENLMIKVPATTEGLPVIEVLIREGINVNVTLLFSADIYEHVVASYIAGLTQRAAAGHVLGRVASVASFFVSRVDTAVDALLEARIQDAPADQQHNLKELLGKAAIANAKLVYQRYRAIFSTPNWKELESKGAQTQRVLWASTGTKNPAYSDVLYVEELIGMDTVNTVPPATLKAFRYHGRIRDSLTEGVNRAHTTFEALSLAGISMEKVQQDLLFDGLNQFVEAFRNVLTAVDKARHKPVQLAEAR